MYKNTVKTIDYKKREKHKKSKVPENVS